MPRQLLSISQLTNYIKGVFEDELLLHGAEIFGEVSNLSSHSNAYYFTLKDESAQISCIHFKPNPNIPIKNGDTICLVGTPKFYTKSGKLSFIAQSFKPYGKGEILFKICQIKEKLLAEGVFDHKKLKPSSITKIGVITSAYGAVMHDIINVVSRRDQSIDLIFCDAKVQGESAQAEILRALQTLSSLNPKPDAVIIARGGGSFEDLEPFNTESVARAVANYDIFTVSAVGHETDTTLCDYAADLRAPTPSAAAELLTVDKSVAKATVFSLARQLNKNFYDLFQKNLSTFNMLSRILTIKSAHKIEIAANSIQNSRQRLCNAFDKKFDVSFSNILGLYDRAHLRLMSLYTKSESDVLKYSELLDKTNPLHLLKQGYARVYNKNGQISSTKDVQINQNIDVRLFDGVLSAKINKIEDIKNEI